MDACPNETLLGRYHDGELAAESIAHVQRHLSSCPQCARRLEGIQQLSALLAEVPRGREMLPIELSRLHAAIERERNDGGLMPLAAGLTATAASILIISLAWLPVVGGSHGHLTSAPAPEPAWERLAAGIDTPPPDSRASDLAYNQDLQTVNWMLLGMAKDPQHEDRRP